MYTQQMMSDAGYLDGNKALWLTFYKQILRVLANTILDIRLQTMGMTDQEALDLMMKRRTRRRKKRRPSCSARSFPPASCRRTLSAGRVGWTCASTTSSAKAASYSLKEFNERALKESGVPLPALDTLLQ